MANGSPLFDSEDSANSSDSEVQFGNSFAHFADFALGLREQCGESGKFSNCHFGFDGGCVYARC